MKAGLRRKLLRGLFNAAFLVLFCFVLYLPMSSGASALIVAPIVLFLGLSWGWAEGKIFAPDKVPDEEKIWLQRADGSCETIADQSQNGILKAFSDFDWEGEIANCKKLGKKKAVPPSLGLGIYGDDHFVNITPFNRDDVEVLYVRTTAPAPDGGSGRNRKKKKAGSHELHRPCYPFKKVDQLIAAWLAADGNKITQLLS